MKKPHLLLLFALAFSSTTSAFATGRSESMEEKGPTRTWEIAPESSGGLTLTKPKNSDSTTVLGAAVGVGYFLTPQLEASLTINYYHFSVDTLSGHVFQFLVGPTFNFCADTENSPFVSVAVGEATTSSTSTYLGTTFSASDTRFNWQAGVGKRFHIADHVSWAPQIVYNFIGEADHVISNSDRSTTDWEIIPFRFAILL